MEHQVNLSWGPSSKVGIPTEMDKIVVRNDIFRVPKMARAWERGYDFHTLLFMIESFSS